MHPEAAGSHYWSLGQIIAIFSTLLSIAEVTFELVPQVKQTQLRSVGSFIRSLNSSEVRPVRKVLNGVNLKAVREHDGKEWTEWNGDTFRVERFDHRGDIWIQDGRRDWR